MGETWRNYGLCPLLIGKTTGKKRAAHTLKRCWDTGKCCKILQQSKLPWKKSQQPQGNWRILDLKFCRTYKVLKVFGEISKLSPALDLPQKQTAFRRGVLKAALMADSQAGCKYRVAPWPCDDLIKHPACSPLPCSLHRQQSPANSPTMPHVSESLYLPGNRSKGTLKFV